MIIAMVRHGQTDANIQGIVQGRIDNPLNEEGKKQALELAKMIKNKGIQFDQIISSPLIRAYDTASIIKDHMKFHLDVIKDDRFLERDFHDLDGMPVEIAMPLVRTKGYSHPGYETDDMIINRISHTLFELEKTYGDQSLLIISHSHVIKALYVYIDPEKYRFTDLIQNGEIRFFEVKHQKISMLNEKTT